MIALEAEKKLIDEDGECIITGIGALNVINALSKIDRSTPIINIGYAGSNSIPAGNKVEVGKVRLYHPNVEYIEPEYTLSGKIPCFTFCDFVTETDIKEPCVFDMELAYILAMGFENVTSIKIVSDNLNVEEFEKCLKK